jgi:Aspartyl protease
MKILSCYLLIAVALLASESRAQQYPAMAAQQAIPFRLEGGLLIEIEGGIEGLQGVNFILDIGSTHSLIDRRLADRCSAERRPGKVFNFDRWARVEWAEFRDVHFGPIQVPNARMMVTELGRRSELVGNADAVIGLDLLSTARKLGIFYNSRTILLTPKEPHAADGPQKPRPENLTVQVIVQGHPIRLLLASGMSTTVLYEDRLRQRLPNLTFTHERKGAHMGRLHGKIARLPNFQLAGVESETEVFLMSGPPADLLSGIDGYLGTSALKAQNIEIDFEGEKLRWQ